MNLSKIVTILWYLKASILKNTYFYFMLYIVSKSCLQNFLAVCLSSAPLCVLAVSAFLREVVFLQKFHCLLVKHLLSYDFSQIFIDPRSLMTVRSEECRFCLLGCYAACVIQIVCPGSGEGKDDVNIYEDINIYVLAELFSFMQAGVYIRYSSNI